MQIASAESDFAQKAINVQIASTGSDFAQKAINLQIASSGSVCLQRQLGPYASSVFWVLSTQMIILSAIGHSCTYTLNYATFAMPTDPIVAISTKNTNHEHFSRQ
ncbi:hypothetical protein BSK55_18420 [Paenibacillus odorifer]|nr:hypothetical protein BSK55_18420 [Paenibacillus odorifer]